jgi:hypothetical protein
MSLGDAGVRDLDKTRVNLGEELQDLGLGMGRIIDEKSGFRDMKFSVIRINSVTSFCWAYNFLI